MEYKSQIVGSSILLLVMFNVFNFLNLLFQIFVAHNLEVVEYGIFTALFSFIYVFGIFSESIQIAVTKEVAKAKEGLSLRSIFDKSLKGSLLVSSLAFIAYLLIFGLANPALEIGWSLIVINGLTVFLSLTSPVVRGILQGRKRFFDLGLSMISEGSAKFLLAVVFIALGWKIYGALTAVVLSMAAPIIYGVGLQIRRDIFPQKGARQAPSGSFFKAFNFKVIIFVGSALVMFMMDTIIARAVLSPENAGYYAIASTIAKMAFIGTQPIGKAMLSHVVSSRGDAESRAVFQKSFGILVLVLVLGSIAASALSPFLVSIFGGSDKLPAAPILPVLLCAVSLLAVANFILFYKIARDKMRFYMVIPIILGICLALLALAPSTLLGFSLYYLAATIIFLMASVLLIR